MTHKNTVEIVTPKDSKPYTDGPICFSGPPGAGKSTVGRRVAEKMTIPFCDIDNLITKKVGAQTTRQIIDKYGRPYFWEVEHQCLKEIFRRKSGRYILALNGGVNCRSDNPDLTEKNKALIRKFAFNICLLSSRNLSESVHILWPRQKDNKRITTYESSNGLHDYLEKRIPLYVANADRTIFTGQAPTEKVIAAVLELLKQ